LADKLRNDWQTVTMQKWLSVVKQETQLLQRGCMMLRVFESFAKSLELIQNNTAEWGI